MTAAVGFMTWGQLAMLDERVANDRLFAVIGRVSPEPVSNMDAWTAEPRRFSDADTGARLCTGLAMMCEAEGGEA